jgi:hypothetical protein
VDGQEADLNPVNLTSGLAPAQQRLSSSLISKADSGTSRLVIGRSGFSVTGE